MLWQLLQDPARGLALASLPTQTGFNGVITFTGPGSAGIRPKGTQRSITAPTAFSRRSSIRSRSMVTPFGGTAFGVPPYTGYIDCLIYAGVQ
jgi:hypothetical protein